MDILESASQLTPIDLLRGKDRPQFSCSVETGQGDNPRPEYPSTQHFQSQDSVLYTES